MIENPIVEEIHRIREAMLKEYGGDLDAMMKAMQVRTEAAARAGRKVGTPPPRARRSGLLNKSGRKAG